MLNPNSDAAMTATVLSAAQAVAAPDTTVSVWNPASGPSSIETYVDEAFGEIAVARMVAASASDNVDAYVIACASDPGIEAARAATRQPVFGVFRCAVAVAATRAERFGVIAIVDASKARHLAGLRAMGLEGRLAAEVALNVSMDTLLDPQAARASLVEASRGCAAAGAGAVILGCTGMAHHRAAMEDAAGVPVIEPCQAAAGVVLGSLPP